MCKSTLQLKRNTMTYRLTASLLTVHNSDLLNLLMDLSSLCSMNALLYRLEWASMRNKQATCQSQLDVVDTDTQR